MKKASSAQRHMRRFRQLQMTACDRKTGVPVWSVIDLPRRTTSAAASPWHRVLPPLLRDVSDRTNWVTSLSRCQRRLQSGGKAIFHWGLEIFPTRILYAVQATLQIQVRGLLAQAKCWSQSLQTLTSISLTLLNFWKNINYHKQQQTGCLAIMLYWPNELQSGMKP